MFEFFLCTRAAFVTFNIWRCVDHLEGISDLLSSIKNIGEDEVGYHLERIADSLDHMNDRNRNEEVETSQDRTAEQ